MSKTQVRVDIDGSHATITFHTDDGVNVLSPKVLESFDGALAMVRQNGGVGSMVVRAEGKVFVAGADIKMMASYNAEQAREYAVLGQGVLNDLASAPCVTVAAINGAAMGGGLELALACDFRIAVKSARLALPEVSLGLIPGWAGIGRLTKLVGSARAKRMYLSALPVSGEEALGFGLVDEIVNSAEDLSSRISAFCKSFRRAAPSAIALAKRASRDMDDIGAFVDCFRTTEAREGMQAFLEKRPAKWMQE
jgi:enoyl-CoA hydratase/carnithine racemase